MKNLKYILFVGFLLLFALAVFMITDREELSYVSQLRTVEQECVLFSNERSATEKLHTWDEPTRISYWGDFEYAVEFFEDDLYLNYYVSRWFFQYEIRLTIMDETDTYELLFYCDVDVFDGDKFKDTLLEVGSHTQRNRLMTIFDLE